MNYQATTTHKRTGRRTSRDVPSAENGAEQLYVLLAAHGWTEERDVTVARLVSGEAIDFQGFEYSVSEGESA